MALADVVVTISTQRGSGARELYRVIHLETRNFHRADEVHAAGHLEAYAKSLFTYVLSTEKSTSKRARATSLKSLSSVLKAGTSLKA